MMPLTDSYVTFARAIETKLENNKSLLGLQAVYFGDQNRIPFTPTACVEPGGKVRALNGMPRRTEVTLTAYVILYHYNLKTAEEIRLNNDQLSESVEALLHQDAQWKSGGQPTVIDSLVTSVESGFQMKRNSLFRASRLTVEARSQVQLPYSAL